MTDIRYVQYADKGFWYSLDKHLPEAEFDKKVRDRMGYVIIVNGCPAGIMRYNMFWDSVPFCTMLYIRTEHRRKGCGRQLLQYWESDMKSKGFGMLLTSTQVNETAQDFYRKSGFKDCGGMVIDIPKYSQPMEMFLVKPI